MGTLFTWEESIETKPSKDILHIDDRIIHEFPDSDRKSSEYHDIDTNTQDIKYDSREKKRDRKWDHSDKCGTSIQKKEYYDDGYDNRGISESFFYIRKSLLDKPCLTEYIIFELDTFRKSFLYFCYFREECIRKFYGIGIWNFRYSDDHSLLPIDEGISSSLTIFPDFYSGYIFQDIPIWEWYRTDFFFGILYGI